jgi:hypothetical protein
MMPIYWRRREFVVEFGGNCRTEMAILMEIGVEFEMKIGWLKVEASQELANPGHTWVPEHRDKIVPNYRVGQGCEIS